ncbi:MAG TPA: hypothetical protein VNA25_28555 [Phycisphaerae bacterium]|nr:hypothetical protein [Phycisphaerae bacterium]
MPLTVEQRLTLLDRMLHQGVEITNAEGVLVGRYGGYERAGRGIAACLRRTVAIMEGLEAAGTPLTDGQRAAIIAKFKVWLAAAKEAAGHWPVDPANWTIPQIVLDQLAKEAQGQPGETP